MINKRPIVLNCFSRGGSNIFWNIFLTHPDLCSPIRETLEIFRSSWPKPTMAGIKVAWLSRQPRLFDQWFLRERSHVPIQAKEYIDKTLYEWKLKTFSDPDMRYKSQDQEYHLEEVKNSRLVIKNNNALAFLSDMFMEMYPGISFFVLVRHPLALYESHKRRGTPVAKSLQHFSHYYQVLAGRMLADAQRFENYHVVRFEDLLVEPIRQAQHIYRLVGEDPSKVRKLRLKVKSHYQSDGGYRSQYVLGQHYWFDFEQVYEFLEPKVNKYHQDRLPCRERDELLLATKAIREKLGYDLQV